MTRPDGAVDPVLTMYFNSAAFRGLAAATQESYLVDYRVFFNFLAARGRGWDRVVSADLDDYEDWRRRAPSNPRPVGGAKFARELAALNRLYCWAVAVGRMDANPVMTVSRIGRDGEVVTVLAATPHDTVTSDVRWLSPRAWRRWRDVGLLGLDTDGVPDRSFRGRSGDRNAAYAGLLFDSGLRRSEAGSLLTLEVPDMVTGHRYQQGRVATAAAKNGSGRPFYLMTSTVRMIRAYQATSRAEAVSRAQREGRYERWPGKLIVEQMPVGRSAVVKWLDEWSGLRSEQRLDRLDPAMRMRLFRRGPEGLEPLWLWVSEAGLPFESHSWNGVFAAATRRCRAVLGAGAPFCTPHMARHSFALYMLIALHHVMDRRFGLSPDQRRDFAILYGDPWRLVKELLGHRSEATTRNIYLAPVAHVHIRSLLEGDMDERAEFLQEVAVASGLVQDVE
jgi:site-specific recombinase XerD